jgi:hypothetical protein
VSHTWEENKKENGKTREEVKRKKGEAKPRMEAM